jgi:hypothetical protein
MHLIVLWFSAVGLLFYFSGRERLRRLPIPAYSVIRAFTLSQLISPTILGFWSGAIPAPAALVVYYGVWMKIVGKPDELVSRNWMGALSIWGSIFTVCFIAILISTFWREHRRQPKEPEA